MSIFDLFLENIILIGNNSLQMSRRQHTTSVSRERGWKWIPNELLKSECGDKKKVAFFSSRNEKFAEISSQQRRTIFSVENSDCVYIAEYWATRTTKWTTTSGKAEAKKEEKKPNTTSASKQRAKIFKVESWPRVFG
jgi:hypothetical protein